MEMHPAGIKSEIGGPYSDTQKLVGRPSAPQRGPPMRFAGTGA